MSSDLTLLLVEDNPGDGRLVREHLANTSLAISHVEHVTTLRETLERLREESYDIILSDLGLPDSQGMQTVESILASAVGTPLVVLTGTEDDVLAERAIQAGAQDYLPKGDITTTLLARTIHHALDRQQHQTALMESEQRFRSVFEASPIGIAIVTPASPSFSFHNSAFRRLLGYTAEDLANLTNRQITHPDDWPAEAQGIASLRNGDSHVFTRTKRLIRNDGQVIWANVSCSMLSSGDGSPEHILMLHENISAQKRASDQILAERARLRTIMETMPALLYLQAPDHSIPLANKRFREYFGNPEGRKCYEIFHGLDQRCDPCRTLDGFSSRQETVRRWADRQGRIFEIRERPFSSENEQRLVLVIATEITSLIQATQALRASERRFRELSEMLPEIVFECDLDGNLTFINNVAFDRYGYTRARFEAGINGLDMLIPEDRETAAQAMQRIIAGKDSLVEEYTAIRNDGTPFPVLIYASLILEDDAPAGLRGILVDISERKRTEQALQDSESRLRSFIENTQLGIYRTTPDGRILMANPALVQMLGFSSFEELASRNLEEGGYEPETPRSDFRKLMEEEGAIVGKESTWTRKNGSTLQVRESARTVRDHTGETLYYEGTLEDVSERARVLAELQKSEERYRNIVELSPVGILTVDFAGRINSCNRALCDMTGYNQAEFLGKHFTRLPAVRPQDLPRYVRTFREIIVGKTPTPFETSWETYAGDIRSGEVHVRVMQSGRGRWDVQVLVQDITERKRSDEQLKESEATHRSILEASPVGIGLIRHGVFEWVSDRICALSGYRSEELIGQSPTLTAPDREEYQRLQQSLRPALIRKGVARTETQWRHKDGTLFDVALHFSNIDRSDHRKGTIFTILDISERKQLERSLTLTQFSIDATDVMIMWLRPSGRLDIVNEASCRLLGYSREDLLNLHVWDLTPNYPRDQRDSLWAALKAGGIELSETDFIRSDGSIFPVELKAQYIHFQDRDYEFVYASDISARKTAERALKESEENYRTIFNSASDAITLHDAKTGQLLDGNAKIEEMFGYPLSDFLGLTVEDFSAPDPAFSNEEALKRIHAAAAGDPQLFEWHCMKKSGDVFWVEVNLRMATLLGTNVVLAAIRDISDRKQLEAHLRQSQKLESIGTLASGVAHEINNPLTGMINYAELISSRVDDLTLREYAEGIKEEGDRVARIVRNLLSFARQDVEHASQARMLDIVDASLSIIGSLLRKDFIQLDIDVADNLPSIRCRSQQIQQVLINLITNARDSLNEKFPISSPEKRIRIQVRDGSWDGQRWLRTVVEDRGIGIPDNLISRVFDPFFTTKTRDRGTGLGLSISYGIIHEHNGRIQVESQEGEFTRFLIDLPVVNCRETPG